MCFINIVLEHGIENLTTYVYFVYNIPYRRARAWPGGCSAFRPSARASKRYLAYKRLLFNGFLINANFGKF